VAVHVTAVDPIGKIAALAGAHTVETGALPPNTLASG
jgi:hypothetical protein